MNGLELTKKQIENMRALPDGTDREAYLRCSRGVMSLLKERGGAISLALG